MSKQTVEKHKEESAREKINMALAEYMFDINSVDMPEEEQESHLLELLGKLGPTKLDGDHYETIVDGYVFWVDKESQEITSKGTDKAQDATNVTVKVANINVNAGATAIIEIEVEPEGASTRGITYESSDTNVATVSNGTVTGISEGTATITVKTKNGKTATCTVTVKENNLTSITVNKESLTFSVGDTTSQKIDTTLMPEDATNKTVVWSTSNEGVATVDNKGNVTAVGKGTCTITVASEKNPEVKAEITVTVSEVEVESISLSDTTLVVPLNGEKELPTVTFTPSDATDKTITWSITNASPSGCVTIEEKIDETTEKITRKIKGVSAGTATITATTSNGKTATCNITVVDQLDVAMTIAEVKAAIAEDGLKKWLGQKVDYNPEGDRNEEGTAKGTWRVFYYNTEAEWGDQAGTLYIKRDFDTNLQTALTLQTSPKTTTIQKMKDMNPMWERNGNSSSIGGDEYNEQAVAWLCDISQWTKYVDSSKGATYAIGSPSVEMYMKAYNIYKSATGTVNTDETKNALMCEVDNTTGYKLGANGSYTWNSSDEYYTGDNSIEEGPGKIFMKSGTNYWWLASPSAGNVQCVCLSFGNRATLLGIYYASAYGVCPVVSL